MARVDGNDTGNSNQRHVNINANIARIEAQIASTKAHLRLLEQQLEEQKSLISPVRKTPVELLSAIF
jgi:septal ring factor EnvC (AmiA/AmiB activator)